jgi:hypothetical protein
MGIHVFFYLSLQPIHTLLQTLKIIEMKKIILFVSVSILGLYTLKAQDPDVIFNAERAFEFRLPESSLWIQCEIYDPKLFCTQHSTAQWFSTTNDAFVFNKPVYTSQIGTLCNEDFHLYVSGNEAMRIERNGYMYIPFGRAFTFGTDINEGSPRLKITHGGTHAYIDYKDNLYFRADLNHVSALTLYGNGSVGVGFGTDYDQGHYKNMGYKLAVNGGIVCEEVKVIGDVPDADYVFEDNYNLSPLSEVEIFIKENKHLPNIPSAEEFKTNGYKLGDMDEMLLRKVEELTLYIIELEKQIQELKEANKKGGE